MLETIAGYVRTTLPPVVLLLERRVIKRAILHDGSANREARAETIEIGLRGFGFERIARVKRRILLEDECITVNRVRAGARDDID